MSAPFQSEAELEGWLRQLDAGGLEVLRAAYESAQAEADEVDPFRGFELHAQQAAAAAGDATYQIVLGGSQSGKSTLLKRIVRDVVRREHPLCQKFKQPPDKPYSIWIVCLSGEKVREDWISPTDGQSLARWLGDDFLELRQSPETVIVTRRGDRILFKSQEQEFRKFEASRVQLIVWDEEPTDKRQVDSAEWRLATTGGAMVFGFTPYNGMTWTYDRWFEPVVEHGYGEQVGDRHWVSRDLDCSIVQMGTADNPAAAEFAEKVRRDPRRTPVEKATRLYGVYGYVQGAFYPEIAGLKLDRPRAEHAVYVVDELPKLITAWYIFLDPNRRYGGCLCCTDNDGNLFFIREHLEESLPARLHAEVFKRWIREDCTFPPLIYGDTGGAGAQNRVDLADFGLNVMPVRKGDGSVSRRIKAMRGLLYIDPKHLHPITQRPGAPRVYFHRPTLLREIRDGDRSYRGSLLVHQLANALQKENTAPDQAIDKTQKHSWDLFDVATYAADGVPEIADNHPRADEIPRGIPLAGPLRNRLPKGRLAERATPGVDAWLDQRIELPDLVGA